VKDALTRYPESDNSEPARYARSMAYLRQPNLQKAMATINSLIVEEPNNPYFYEVRGQTYMSMARPAEAIPDYQKSVDLRPRAAQLRLALATAQLATESDAMAAPARRRHVPGGGLRHPRTGQAAARLGRLAARQ